VICDDLELRLYDEDCRGALLGHAPVPADVAGHLAGCATCREAWAEAARNTVAFTRDLLLPTPPSLIRNAAAALQPAARPLPGWHDFGIALTAGAILSVVAALIPGAGPLWQWSGFWTGAACGLVASVIDRNVALPSLPLPS